MLKQVPLLMELDLAAGMEVNTVSSSKYIANIGCRPRRVTSYLGMLPWPRVNVCYQSGTTSIPHKTGRMMSVEQPTFFLKGSKQKNKSFI